MSNQFTPNMSHCAVENTAAAVEQVLALIEAAGSTADWVAGLSEHELHSVDPLLAACRDLLDAENHILHEVDTATA